MKQREATKKVRQLIKFFPSSFYGYIQDPGSEIRDGKKSGSEINIPDPQHCRVVSILWFCDACNTNILLHIEYCSILPVQLNIAY